MKFILFRISSELQVLLFCKFFAQKATGFHIVHFTCRVSMSSLRAKFIRPPVEVGWGRGGRIRKLYQNRMTISILSLTKVIIINLDEKRKTDMGHRCFVFYAPYRVSCTIMLYICF